VLTAAHCVEGLVANGNERDLLIFFGTNASTGDVFVPVDAIRMHRYWLGEDHRYDIAIIHMAEEAPSEIEPVELNTRALDQSFVGAEIRVVGFGQTEEDSGGTKRHGITWVRSVASTYIYLESGEVNVCFGDSGGPTFHDFGEGEQQVGIATLTWDCGLGGETRVDIFLDNFVWPLVDAFEGPCALDDNCVTDCPRGPDPDCDPCAWDGVCASGCPEADWDCPLGKEIGEACANGDECEHRICEAAPEDPRVAYCTRVCAVDEAIECPDTMECADPDGEGLRCMYEAATPRVLGAACGQDLDCRSEICEARICVEPCSEVPGGVCPAPFECRTGTTRDIEVCGPPLSASDSGCVVAAGSGRGRPLALLLCVVLLLVAARRR